MILCLADVLTPEELSLILSKLEEAEFADGKLTAGWYARQVKQNNQLRRDDVLTQELQKIVSSAFKRNTLFQTAVLPKTISPIRFNRYQTGMAYGRHIDNAVMSGNELMRTDVSFTLFLSEPSDYEEGELIIESPQGEQAFKLPAGSMITYPSDTLHRVEAVTAGTRLAAIGWVQSLVREASKREILFDLETVIQTLYARQGQGNELDLLLKTRSNLLRQWVEI